MTQRLQWPTDRLTAGAILTLGCVAHAIVATVCVVSPDGHTGDFQRYWQLATMPGRPHVDFAAEYPPGALLMFGAIASVAGDIAAFVQWSLAINVLTDAGIVLLLVTGWGTLAAAVYAWMVLPILSLLFFRFDLWPIACAVLAVVLLRRNRPAASAVALASGVALKLWPLVLAGFFLPGLTWRRWQPVLWACGSAFAVAIGWFWFGGSDGFTDVLTYREATGWDIESSVGSVWRLVEPDTVRQESGTRRVGRLAPLISVLLGLLTLPLGLWAVARGVLTRQLGTGWVAGVGAILVGAALLSPQFLGWLVPAAAIAWTEGDRRSAKLVAVAVVLTVVYRLLHTSEVPVLVLLRNLVLMGTVVQAFIKLAAQPIQHESVFGLESHRPPGRRI